MKKSANAWFLSCVFALFIQGCSSSDSSSYETYRVQRGDTLYAIAFKYGMDYKSLARLNGISAPYRIYIGQILKLGAAAESGSSYIVRSGDTLSEIAETHGSSVRTLALLNDLSSPYTLYVGQRLKLAGVPSKAAVSLPVKSAAVGKNVSSQGSHRASGIAWSWPTDGKIISTYEAEVLGHKGINISGNLNQEVRAAADGEVVYAGNALRGYGNLVILNHPGNYLSAYAHNERLLVKEGQQVRRGERIATMGSTDTDRVQLLFELRHEGETVDPLAYLPR